MRAFSLDSLEGKDATFIWNARNQFASDKASYHTQSPQVIICYVQQYV